MENLGFFAGLFESEKAVVFACSGHEKSNGYGAFGA